MYPWKLLNSESIEKLQKAGEVFFKGALSCFLSVVNLQEALSQETSLMFATFQLSWKCQEEPTFWKRHMTAHNNLQTQFALLTILEKFDHSWLGQGPNR